MKNQTIENRRDFLKRIAIGTVASGVIYRSPARRVKSSTAGDVRAAARRAKERYRTGTADYREAVIEKLFDDYKKADSDLMRNFLLNLGAFLTQ